MSIVEKYVASERPGSMDRSIRTTLPESKKTKVNFQTFKNAIVRHPVSFTLLLMTSCIVGAGVWIFLPLPKNTAMVVFQLSGNTQKIIPGVGEGQTDLKTIGLQQSATLKRRVVMSNALNNPEVNNLQILEKVTDKITWLDKNLTIDFKNGPGLMRLVLEGDQPEEILTIIKVVSAAYLAEVDLKENGARKQKLNLILDAISKQQDAVSQKTANIDRIAKLLKTTDGPTLAVIDQLNQDELKSARKSLIELDYKLESIKVEMAGLENSGEKETSVVPKEALEEAIRKDPAMVLAENKVAAAKQLLFDLESRFEPGTKNQTLTKAKQELLAAEEAREKLKTELRTQGEGLVKSQLKNEFLSRQAKVKENYNQLLRQKNVIDAQVEEIMAKINKHGAYRFDLDKYRKEIASTEKILASLAEERDRLSVEDKAPSRVSIAEEAFVQSGIEGNRRIRAAMIASFCIAGMGIAFLIWRELRGRRVTALNDLSEQLGLTVLGSIPKQRQGMPKEDRSLIESIDSMRTHLLQARHIDNPLRTIMVASGLAGEGKTTLAGHLAVSLARAGYRVLLVDGDLHAPSFCGIFELPATPGLSEVLRGESQAVDAIHNTPITGLSVMPSGSWDMITRQCLVGDAWKSLRTDLEKCYDFVIIDTAPLLLITDTLLLAKSVDAVILSVLIGSSRIEVIDQALEKLAALQIRVLGAVLNGTDVEFSHEYYGRHKNLQYRQIQSTYKAANASSRF